MAACAFDKIADSCDKECGARQASRKPKSYSCRWNRVAPSFYSCGRRATGFMTKPLYSELLRDPRWDKKRKEILYRDEYTCQSCGETNCELHVHHKYYKNGLFPWEYHDDALITFCAECHDIEHERIKSLPDRTDLSFPSHISDSISLIVIRNLSHLSPDEIKLILMRKMECREISASFLASLMACLNIDSE